MSFVVLVINEAVEKSSNSLVEKLITLLVTLLLKSLLKLVAILVERYVLEIVKQSNENKIITNCKKNIDKISKYEFDGDQVVVKFSSNLETSYKHVNTETNEEEEKQNIQSTSGDEITLQKVDGKWKIVYSYLDYYQNSSDLYLY